MPRAWTKSRPYGPAVKARRSSCPRILPSSEPPTRDSMSSVPAPAPYRTWMCLVCGFVYDEAAGSPDDGLAPGTRWEDVPANWACPECGARKEDFEMVEL